MLSWAFAKSEHPKWCIDVKEKQPHRAVMAGKFSPPLLSAVRGYLDPRKLAKFNLVELSALMWAFGSAGACQGEGAEPYQMLGDALVHKLSSNPLNVDSQGIAVAAWAFASMRQHHPQVSCVTAKLFVSSRESEAFAPS